MKVLNRSQVTHVEIKRLVSHYVEVGSVRYIRRVTVNVNVPYMDIDVLINKAKPKWYIYVKDNVIQTLLKSEVEKLGLEELFLSLDIESINGNKF